MRSSINKLPVLVLLLAGISSNLAAQKIPGSNEYFKTPVFTIDSVAWCSQIVNDKPKGALKIAKVGQPLFFWVRLQSDDRGAELFTKLNQPVIIKWFQLSGDGASPEWNTKPQVKNNRLENKAYNLEKKNVSQKKNEVFRYATWISLPYVKRTGACMVRLVYYDNSPVHCGNQPCEFKIEVQQ